eukprot:Phypoly_transcript_01231.p1 GENE.Phypoly_transcript_01231~~Phypoly_transcript_01231.p1  ORF type:complete len:641 (+),score=42.00 Phypoly_transcript_01231:1600-3522(+)
MGKSTTIYLAASQTGSSYVRIRLDQGVLGTANQLMDVKLRNIKSITVSALRSLLAPICFGALARTFDQCSTMLKQKKDIDFRQISTNGIEEQSQKECVFRLQALIDKINTVTHEDTSFVLHIDEAHSWSVLSTFTQKAPLESVECKELHYYKFIVLSEVLEDLRSQSEKLKICITGTNTFVDRILRFASNFKCRIIWLGLITADVAKEICSKFLNLECLPSQQMDILMEKIGYNGRSIQYFLHRVRKNFNEHSTSDNITFNTLLKCADEAYSEWLGIITNTKEIRNSNEEQRYTTLAQLMVVFAYPGAWRAVLQSDGALLLSEDVFPEAWRTFAEAGAFRVQVNADGLLLHPPKGFVLRWITETLTRRIHSETLLHFTAFALSASTDKIGGPGHWFEKAIAAELTLPTSPLYSRIIHGIAGTNNLHPDPSVVMRPVIFTEAKIYTLAGQMQGVYCVRDLNQDCDRWVDGGFSLLDANNSKVDVWLDMKTVTDENKLWRCIGEFFNHPLPLGIRMFVSLYDFLQHSPQQKRSQKKSAHDCRADVIAKLSEVDANGQHQYVIIAGPLSFNDCVLPITTAIKNLEADDFKLYPAEENYSLRHVLENLVPQVLLAKEQGRKRTQIAPPPMHRSQTFIQSMDTDN